MKKSSFIALILGTIGSCILCYGHVNGFADRVGGVQPGDRLWCHLPGRYCGSADADSSAEGEPLICGADKRDLQVIVLWGLLILYG